MFDQLKIYVEIVPCISLTFMFIVGKSRTFSVSHFQTIFDVLNGTNKGDLKCFDDLGQGRIQSICR
jgi:hypothetical protein